MRTDLSHLTSSVEEENQKVYHLKCVFIKKKCIKVDLIGTINEWGWSFVILLMKKVWELTKNWSESEGATRNLWAMAEPLVTLVFRSFHKRPHLLRPTFMLFFLNV